MEFKVAYNIDKISKIKYISKVKTKFKIQLRTASNFNPFSLKDPLIIRGNFKVSPGDHKSHGGSDQWSILAHHLVSLWPTSPCGQSTTGPRG